MAATSASKIQHGTTPPSPKDSLKCYICLKVAKDPWQHGKCGTLFCEYCLLKHGKEKPCPHCKMDKPMYMEDNKSKREINAFRVKCDNFESGCEWDGILGTLKHLEHQTSCQYAPVPCPKECKNSEKKIQMIVRKDLDEHLKKECSNRDYECKYCQKKGTYASITHIHDYNCEKKIVPCPNAKCTKTMKRMKIKKHLEDDCEYTAVSCKYRNIGCEAKMARIDMAVHEHDDKAHLHQALDVVLDLKEKVQIATKTITSLKKKCEGMTVKLQSATEGVSLLRAVSMTFKLTDYKNMKEKEESFYCDSFYTSSEGYHMIIKVNPNGEGHGKGTHVSVYAHLVKGDHDEKLHWPFTGTVTCELLNQLADSNHHKRNLIEPKDATKNPNGLHVGNGLGFGIFIPHSKLSCDLVHNVQYLKDDTLFFRVTVEVSGYKSWLECKAL